MMTCHYFRTNLQPGNADSALLEHLRSCDACLAFSMSIDPDLFFRSLGSQELVPPGGIDAFVGDVMAQVRVRETEASLVPRRDVRVWQRWAVAATVAAGITGATLGYRYEHAAPQPVPVIATAKAKPAPTATKSFVETYSSHDATIVEMPSDGSDTKIVMIFDDKLPADL